MVVGEDYVAATSSANHVSAVQIPVCNAGDTMKQIVGLSNMVVRRNGWIYIYLSNESAQDVYFDNLVINLKHGPLVEQKDYYAYGMENPTLSTQALKPSYNPNRIRYNGKELQAQEFKDGSGLTWDDYGARMYDPQIGRWMVNDPLSEKNRRWSAYTYANDNPVRFIDPDGMESVDAMGKTEDYSGNSHTYKIDGVSVSATTAMAYANAKLSTGAATSSSSDATQTSSSGNNGDNDGGKKQKAVGATVTVMTSVGLPIVKNLPGGDRAELSGSTGGLVGEEGEYMNFNITTLDKKLKGLDLTFLHTTISLDLDGKGLGFGISFGKYSATTGFSMTSGITTSLTRTSNHSVSTIDGSYRPGLETLALAPAIYFSPFGLPAATSLLKVPFVYGR